MNFHARWHIPTGKSIAPSQWEWIDKTKSIEGNRKLHNFEIEMEIGCISICVYQTVCICYEFFFVGTTRWGHIITTIHLPKCVQNKWKWIHQSDKTKQANAGRFHQNAY